MSVLGPFTKIPGSLREGVSGLEERFAFIRVIRDQLFYPGRDLDPATKSPRVTCFARPARVVEHEGDRRRPAVRDDAT